MNKIIRSITLKEQNIYIVFLNLCNKKFLKLLKYNFIYTMKFQNDASVALLIIYTDNM